MRQNFVIKQNKKHYRQHAAPSFEGRPEATASIASRSYATASVASKGLRIWKLV